MTVTRRTRFEILRRDNYTCRYCGGKAPDVELHVDHVTPVALGGTDDPSNLAAACKDCNAGKASTSPDEETVADVAEGALRWAQAMARAVEIGSAKDDQEVEVIERFTEQWSKWTTHGGSRLVPMSSNWRETVLNYWRSGLPVDEIESAVAIAMNKGDLKLESVYPYYCGILRNRLKQLAEIASDLIERGEV